MIADTVFDEGSLTFSSEKLPFVPDAKGVGHAFFTQMRINHHKVAQYDVETGVTETFGELLKRCICTALVMQDHNIRPGDIVSICASNSMDNVVPYVAIQFIGAVVASFDPKISLADTVHLLKQTEPKMIFVGQECVELIRNAVHEAGLRNCKMVMLDEFLRPHTSESSFTPFEVADLATTSVILFSSGTTGLSKGICLSHKSVLNNGHLMVQLGYKMDRTLSFATTYWVSSVVFITIQCVYGKMRCIVKTFNADKVWKQIESAGVTYVFMAPSQVVSMVVAGRPEGVNTSCLRDVMIAGGPLSVAYYKALRDLLPGSNVLLVYGQTEMGGLMTYWRVTDRGQMRSAHNKPTSSGKLVPGVTARVVDPLTDLPVGPSAVGELRYKSESMMTGYYKLDDAVAYDSEGWIRSGDMVYFDEDMCIYIVDRIKEMLKYQSFHVSPAKIEAMLTSHPKVHSAVVIGVPDDADGDHPMALVRLRPGAEVSEDELVMFVNTRIDDGHHLRAGVRFLDTFPLTPSGKVKKTELRNMVLAGELA